MNARVEKDPNGYEYLGVRDAIVERRPFRDFGGVNSNGNHHFAIRVPEDCVDIFKNFGFEPKYLDGKDGQYEPKWILDIVVGFKFKDPGVFLVAHDMVRSQLKEEELGDLDGLTNIAFADVNLLKHHWKMNGRTGIKPYAENLHLYLNGPSYAEQSYMERCQAVVSDTQVIEQPELDFAMAEEDDIPF